MLDDAVLVVIDAQNGFVNEHSQPVIKNILTLVNRCRERAIPTVFTRFINTPKSQYETLIDWTKVAMQPDIDIVDDLTGLADTVINKHYYTAFTYSFSRLVHHHGWRKVIICGISTESCVLKTAADAFERGLRPVVVADAVSSNAGADAHHAGLLVLKFLIGERQIVMSDDLFKP